MNEKEWVTLVIDQIRPFLQERNPQLEINQGTRLAYTNEILQYRDAKPKKHHRLRYETDILIRERIDDATWIPRLVIEAKINSVTTHDAITYSQKAQTHKSVHPYLRYGIIIGNRKHYPLPGRLFRHGAHFDFMLSWKAFEPKVAERNSLINLIFDEVKASRDLEEIIFNSRSPEREQYTYLHRPLRLKKLVPDKE